MPRSAQEYAEMIRTYPQLKRFLDLIAWSEGGDYNVGFGKRRINDLSWHPYRKGTFYDPRDGSPTSAAGRYQYVRGTWERVARALGLRDFSPQSQDVGAVYLIEQRGALRDVLSGNVVSAIQKLKPEWESFKDRPLSALLSWYKNGKSSATSFVSNESVRTSQEKFSDFLNVKVVSNEQRYMIAFTVLAVVFIFGFSK